jgi:hypothetical protein
VRRAAGTKILGVVVIAVSVWGGIVPFVGPTFDFDMGSTTRSWVWTQSHWTLHLAPAVLGIAAGLMLLLPDSAAAKRTGAFLTLVAGGWFVLGPTLAPLWQHGGVTTSGSDGVTGSRTQRVLEGVGYHNGTGVTLMLLGAVTLWLCAAAPAAAPPTEPEPEPSQATTDEDTRVRPHQPAPV